MGCFGVGLCVSFWIVCCWNGCVVYAGVVVGLLLCCLSMVGGMGDMMWEHCCCMMLLAVYMRMVFFVDIPCCGLLMFCHYNCSGYGWCKSM